MAHLAKRYVGPLSLYAHFTLFRQAVSSGRSYVEDVYGCSTLSSLFERGLDLDKGADIAGSSSN